MNGPAPDEGARQAAGRVVRSVLRWHEGGGRGEAEAPAERGWYLGAAECALDLARATGCAVTGARAFGGDWPVIHGDGWLVAPALPLALPWSGGEGVDAAYAWRDHAVWREAAGIEEPFLTTSASGPGPGTAFDLLWFGDCERYTLRRGTLAVEDLFATVEVPADRGTIERLVVRARRVDPAVLDGLVFAAAGGPTTITVNRAVELNRGGDWRDAERFLRARADVERTDRGGDRVVAHTAGGSSPVFSCEDRLDGWVLKLIAGDYPLTGLEMSRRGETLSLSADLHPAIDPLAPGMRGRLAFDLRSDLVSLG